MVNVLKLIFIGLALFAVFGEGKKRKKQPSAVAPSTEAPSTVAPSTIASVADRKPKADLTKVDIVTPAHSTPEPSPRSRQLPLVYLEVLDAKIGTDYDWLSQTDCFVKVEVKNPDNFSYEAGKTRVAVDMINPEFYQVFKLEKLRTDSVITLKLFDNDYLMDTSIGEVSIELENVLKMDQNYREMKLHFNDDHDYIAVRIMIIATLVDYSEDRKRNEVAKDSLLITCCRWSEFKDYVNNMHNAKKDSKQTKADFGYIVQFTSFFDDILMKQICSEKYFHESFCSRLNSTETIPIYDQMLSTLLINL